MTGMRIYRASNRTPLASSYRGKLVFAVLCGALMAPFGLVLWSAFAAPVASGMILVALLSGLAGAALAAWLLRGLLAPVESAASVAAAALEGRALPVRPVGGTDMAARLLSDVSRLASGGDASRAVAALAPLTDPLTGLRNRHWCETRLTNDLLHSRGDYVLAVIDVEGLGRINETHGRQVGDACLRKVAGVTRDTLRTGDTLARWGEDEFMAVLRGGRDKAEAALERLRTRVNREPVIGAEGVDVRLSVTIGAVACKGGQPVDALMRAADRAAAEARERRSERVAFFGA